MPDTPSSTHQPSRQAIRASVACAPCRYKHLRCDGRKPACSRCVTDVKECIYPHSRRRGNPKKTNSPLHSKDSVSGTHSLRCSDSDPLSSISVGSGSDGKDASNDHDQRLLALYYEFFHAAHPCVLPDQVLKHRLAEEALQPLLVVMQYIGSLFATSIPSEGRNEKAQLLLADLQTRNRAITGFDVQAVLLYSITIYWCNDTERGVELLDEAIRMAVEIGINRKEFALCHGQNDPVLEESWRRTWWLIYITDAHIAGSTHTFPFRTSRIDVTVELPCEEQEYESGNIPHPKTSQEYDNREFMQDDESGFSSYAELVGLTRGVDLALAPGHTSDVQLYRSMCNNADTSIAAWNSLLPASKRCSMRRDGNLDEVMFKAYFIMYTYTVELHRPLSTLAYSSIESVSRCAPRAPSCNTATTTAEDERQLHTVKCLRAIDQLDGLLTLPTNITTHSPFIICMIANATIAHLSACRFVMEKKRAITTGREKIRLAMGTLKVLSEHWLLGKRTYREIATIAREILSLTTTVGSRDATSAMADVNVDVDGSQTMSLAEFPSLDLLPDGSLDFGDLFDSNVPHTVELVPQWI